MVLEYFSSWTLDLDLLLARKGNNKQQHVELPLDGFGNLQIHSTPINNSPTGYNNNKFSFRKLLNTNRIELILTIYDDSCDTFFYMHDTRLSHGLLDTVTTNYNFLI